MSPTLSYTLPNNTVVRYDDPFKVSEEYVRTVGICTDTRTSPILALIHPRDAGDYDGDAGIGAQARLAVVYLPITTLLPWGCIFPYTMNGICLPTCRRDVFMKGPAVFCEEVFLHALQNMRREQIRKHRPTFNKVLGKDHEAWLKWRHLW